ncbi:hypothetical protein TUN199_05834 [Pyrenophora tritici-repentis]|nr:hypothetical protein Alg130_00465 [Pyrenophora tritici-repentis]KAI0615298.1 hypothetical protein TUN205_00386 [Pyrenophora tritici-repentis]KAI0622175.1 hypothetical protein TUN199_05834 [Pyrenophora tritici-repentis]
MPSPDAVSFIGGNNALASKPQATAASDLKKKKARPLSRLESSDELLVAGTGSPSLPFTDNMGSDKSLGPPAYEQ